ncbi:hypothetical protein Bpfe_013965 [Biomphalaria pfeifferi]|uniref:Uncharacterized protein n=1 Tax=Biomphalaria pfeifferi TaxID=112525 RepID=A0AAD8F9J6_BIOPF|nr:hypothetical protein Bpfe_013965 [Biomphalaria pfeifferi]
MGSNPEVKLELKTLIQVYWAPGSYLEGTLENEGGRCGRNKSRSSKYKEMVEPHVNYEPNLRSTSGRG